MSASVWIFPRVMDARTKVIRLVMMVVVCCVAAACTTIASAEPFVEFAADNMHAMGMRVASWTVLSAVLPAMRSVAPQLNDDSLRINSGDPTNTDLPFFFPPSRTTRRSLSPQQRRDRSIPIPKGYSTAGSVDSLLREIRLRELMNGYDIGVDVPIPLDLYMSERRDEILSALRDSSLMAYEIKKPLSGSELTKLIDQATNITIPLPPNPLFGIFGKPEISINVNGEVNVQAGWRWDTQRLGTASVLGQTQSAPIFNQNIQVNVSATSSA